MLFKGLIWESFLLADIMKDRQLGSFFAMEGVKANSLILQLKASFFEAVDEFGSSEIRRRIITGLLALPWATTTSPF